MKHVLLIIITITELAKYKQFQLVYSYIYIYQKIIAGLKCGRWVPHINTHGFKNKWYITAA